MSYQVLARKWRPKNFTDVVGQKHVLTTLLNALNLGRVHHAYLLSGTRGVGKTSIARLLAKGLNCESGITAAPCGQCENCIDIAKGRFIDLIEIDAASRTKVEDTREILDNIQYMPTKGRFKVYLIDEVHMLSKSSFNALLKTLEEPPEHVKFLLATTDPQKLPITILSRCLHLHLSLLDNQQINNQLIKILKTESINYDENAVMLLAKEANGSMRDALSLTDQAIALGNGRISYELVCEMLGTIDKQIPFKIINKLHLNQGEALLNMINEAINQGLNLTHLLTETQKLIHQIALIQIVPTAVGEYLEQEEPLRYLAQQIQANDLQLYYQILLMGQKDLNLALDKKMALEMIFLRALAFTPKSENQQTAQKETQTQKISLTNKEATKTQINQKPTSKPSIAINVTQDHSEAKHAKIKENLNDNKPKSKIDVILAARQQLIDAEQSKKKVDANITPEAIKLSKKSILTKNNETTLKKGTVQNDLETNTVKQKINNKQNTNVNKNIVNEDLNESPTAKTYQWQFSAKTSNHLEDENNKEAVKNKKESACENHASIIAMTIKIDAWCAEIEAMNLPPLIKQIAINSVIEKQSESNYLLRVKSCMTHLINNSNIKQLNDLYSQLKKQKVLINAVIDDNFAQKTPTELRKNIYNDQLLLTKQKAENDEKLTLIKQLFNAELIEDSIELNF